MSEPWVIVADQSKARFFTVSDTSTLIEIKDLVQTQARRLEQTLTSDRPGRSFDSGGKGSHAMGSQVEPAKQEAIRFAKAVAESVRSAHNEGHCNRILLVAGPPLLGLLRADLKSVSGIEISELDKNLGHYDAVEIRKHLPKRI